MAVVCACANAAPIVPDGPQDASSESSPPSTECPAGQFATNVDTNLDVTCSPIDGPVQRGLDELLKCGFVLLAKPAVRQVAAEDDEIDVLEVGRDRRAVPDIVEQLLADDAAVEVGVGALMPVGQVQPRQAVRRHRDGRILVEIITRLSRRRRPVFVRRR